MLPSSMHHKATEKHSTAHSIVKVCLAGNLVDRILRSLGVSIAGPQLTAVQNPGR